MSNAIFTLAEKRPQTVGPNLKPSDLGSSQELLKWFENKKKAGTPITIDVLDELFRVLGDEMGEWDRPIWEKWIELGGERSTLGYPRALHAVFLEDLFPGSSYTTGWRYLPFDHGEIHWTIQSGAHAMQEVILEKWKSLGKEQGRLHYPTTDELTIPDGSYQDFEGGSIYVKMGQPAYEIHEAIRDKWLSLGGASGQLGHLASDGLPLPEGEWQQFERGVISWRPSTGAHVVRGAILEKWKSLGKEQGRLYYPTTDELTIPDGSYQDFEGGALYCKTGQSVYLISNPIKTEWLRWGRSRLGYPIAEEESAVGGSYQKFERAIICHKNSIHAYAVEDGPIKAKWGGVNSQLGYPITSLQVLADGSSYQDFERGSLYHKRATGAAFEVHGTIRDRWLKLDGIRGMLGYPTSDGFVSKNIPMQKFEAGSIIDVSSSVSAALDDGRSLPLIPYKLTLDHVYCQKETPGLGSDDVWLRFVVSASPAASKKSEKSTLVAWRNDNVDTGFNASPQLILFEGQLPDTMIVSLLGLESDNDGKTSDVMRKFEADVCAIDKEIALDGKAISDAIDAGMTAGAIAGAVGGAVVALAVGFTDTIIITIGGVVVGQVSGSTGGFISGGMYGAVIGAVVGIVIGAGVGVYNYVKPPELLMVDRTMGQPAQLYSHVTAGTLPANPAPMNMEGGVRLLIAYYRDPATGDMLEDHRYISSSAEGDYTLSFRHHFG